MIEFHLNTRSAVPPYMQLVQQVRQALRVGLLEQGDQLPTVREAATELAINPNTVLKAYRQLEHEALIAGRPGQGTFVVRTLSRLTTTDLAELRRRLEAWIAQARQAGLNDDEIEALISIAMRGSFRELTA
jgi:GntR family transcriptional regulator